MTVLIARRWTMLQSKVFPLTPYTPLLIVLVGDASGEEIHAYLKRRYRLDVPKFKQVGKDWAGASFRHGQDFVFVWVRFLRNKDDHELVCHEAFHATCRVMKIASVKKLVKENEECWAYLLGYIVNCVLTWRRK